MKKLDEDGRPAMESDLARVVASSVARMLGNQGPGGAFIASPDFAEYQYCWLRDGSFTAYALDRAGEHEASRAFHEWSAAAIEGIVPVIARALDRRAAGQPIDPARMPPARFDLSGRPVGDDWPNFQVDGYGTWLWSLQQHLERSGEKALPSRLAPSVASVGRYLVEFGTSPCYDVWEESGDSVHTATLGCVAAGLRAAASMLGAPELAERAASLQASLLDQGRRVGRFAKSDHSQQVDAALLWLCEPFQLVSADEPAFVETVRAIAAELDLEGGTRRYPTDTYYGGGAWPVLTASLGLYYARAGDLTAAERRLDWVAERVDDHGRLAEQFGGEERDPEHYQEWLARWGPPAADLVWSHAMCVVLATALGPPQAPPDLATETEPLGSQQ